jgi:hypothetical protein
MPVLPYQRTLYEALQTHKHLFIKKSRGIGVTTFLLRYIAWCCVSDFLKENSRVCIVTRPRIDLAADLVARFKGLFRKDAFLRQSFDSSKMSDVRSSSLRANRLT